MDFIVCIVIVNNKYNKIKQVYFYHFFFKTAYIYYDVNEILPKLSDEDVRLLYEQILNLPELTQDGVIFFINDKIIRLGDEQYCILWDKIITIQYTLSNDNMACVRLAFSDDEKTVNKLELYSDMYVFSVEEYEKKCRQYKIEYKFTRTGMKKDMREFHEKLNDTQ